MRLRDFMQAPPYTCAPTTTLALAARRMESHNIGSLVVCGDDEKVVGIVTDRDLALALGRRLGPDAAVSEVMSLHVVTIHDDASLDDAAALMDSHAVRRLPVVDAAGRPIGIVCLDDLYGYLLQETMTLTGAVRAQGGPHA